MFYLVGTGQNIYEIPIGTIKVTKKSDLVFFEGYTSVFSKRLLEYLKKKRSDIVIVDRKFVEEELESIILENKEKKITLIVPGDPLIATTHLSLISFCKENDIKYKIIHASSILNHIAKTGLFVYKFGKTASIPFHDSDVPYLTIYDNLNINAHTLLLLDLDPLNNKYLTVKEALNKLKISEEKIKKGIISDDKKIIVCCRLGKSSEKIYYLSIKECMEFDFGKPPFSIIYPSDLNPIEEELLNSIKDNI